MRRLGFYYQHPSWAGSLGRWEICEPRLQRYLRSGATDRLLCARAVTRVNESETYRGPVLALVEEVRRLRGVAPGNESQREQYNAGVR